MSNSGQIDPANYNCMCEVMNSANPGSFIKDPFRNSIPIKETNFWEESTINNPFWTKELSKLHFLKVSSEFVPLNRENSLCTPLARHDLAFHYGFGILSPSDLDWLSKTVENKEIIEVGAGGGYTGYLLEQLGFHVICTDLYPPNEDSITDNPYHINKVWQPALKFEGATAAAMYPTRTLLISWPGTHERWPHETLLGYRGDTIIYQGEGYGGNCANDAFFKRLHTDWEVVDYHFRHLTFDGIHDTLSVWRRKK